MKKRAIAIGMLMIFVVMVLGCNSGSGFANETKLEEHQGLGVVGSLNVEEFYPELDGYISLVVRNNLGGEPARNVYVSLDNLGAFKIFACGKAQDSPDKVRECSGEFGLDSQLPYRAHGETKMFPGDEREFFWRLRAPDQEEISNIALRQSIAYTVDYTYRTTFIQNIIFMSSQEVQRRNQAGEVYQIEGEAKNGAGELKVTGTTAQPVQYFFDNSNNLVLPESESPFALQYSVKNEGEGIPISDVIVLIELPTKKSGRTCTEDTYCLDVEPQLDKMERFGWYYWNDFENKNCETGQGTVNCKDWVQTIYTPEEFKSEFQNAIDTNRLIVKIVTKNDFIDTFPLNVPLKLNGGDSKENRGMYALKNFQIPLEIYGFKIHNMYRYEILGSSDVVVYPLKI